ncbi:MAG: LpxI family protein [Aquificota bacterium]|nr:LpxI family protein [Aquificota bacterium]
MDLLEEEGFEFIDPKPFLERILADEGTMGRKRPSRDALEDGVFGFLIAKEIAEMDVGQTVVVKDRVVVAVEAMEGTQETIRRGGALAGRGIRVVKVARKSQDFRIDVPTVGMDTLKVLKESGADALFLEAGRVYIVEKEKFIRTADRFGIPVVGLR